LSINQCSTSSNLNTLIKAKIMSKETKNNSLFEAISDGELTALSDRETASINGGKSSVFVKDEGWTPVSSNGNVFVKGEGWTTTRDLNVEGRI
jgi:hypothetical protein